MSSGQSEGSIYALSDPLTGEIRYIGQTVNSLQRRLYLHIFVSPTQAPGTSYRERWVAQMLRRGTPPLISLVQTLPTEHLDDAEIYWIAYFKMIGCDLVNVHPGGNGGWSHLVGKPGSSAGKSKSPETRAKIRASLVGRSLPDATKVKMAAARQRDREHFRRTTTQAWADGKLSSHWVTTDRSPVICPCGAGPFKGAVGLKIHATKSECGHSCAQ